MCRGDQRLRAREMPRAGDARRRPAWEPERTPIVVPTPPPAARRLPDLLVAPSDPWTAGPPAPPGLGGHLLLGPDAAPLPEAREGPRFFMTPSPFLRWRLCRLCPRPLSSRTGALCSVASRALWPCREPGRPSTQGRLPVVVVRRENGSEKPEFFRLDFRLSPGRELCRAVGEHAFSRPLGKAQVPRGRLPSLELCDCHPTLAQVLLASRAQPRPLTTTERDAVAPCSNLGAWQGAEAWRREQRGP